MMQINEMVSTHTVNDSKPIRFIGSKSKLLTHIGKIVQKQCGTNTDLVFGDLFCGTAVVSRYFKQLGYSITANDSLTFCTILAKAELFNNQEPKFNKLLKSSEIPLSTNNLIVATPYDLVLNHLNSLKGMKGFIYNEYSPGGSEKKCFKRQYFTDENAQRIDAIRNKIADWKSHGLINEGEAALLIADLIKATNKIANIAGTYGYFLKFWDPRTKNKLILRRSEPVISEKKHHVFQKDANSLVKEIDCDILYLDPPYTWRHYGAYYHILETIALWDNPQIEGLSGLRDWEQNKSRYCYRDDAANALQELIDTTTSKNIFLSYNSDGLIAHDEICRILSTIGKPIVHEIDYRRYKSNSDPTGNVVKERLYCVKRK